ncbi:MAG: NAD(P)-dependent oxidoreductase [Candidatus Marinimicrobia bacterium]|nr:NAD(P)-dependent oxidoreductase [Candidatus Neomarinimicrobiota bacterium]
MGNELTRQLLEKKYTVTVLDRFKKDIPYVKSIKADITNKNEVHDILKDENFDLVFHLASLPGDTGNPKQMIDVNVLGLMNILEWVRTIQVKKFVLTSSISALEWYPGTKFVEPKYIPVDEEHPANPKDMYSTTKRMQELLTKTYFHEFHVPISILRLVAVIGPGGKGGGRSWYEFARMLKQDKKVQIPHFNENEICHYVDVRDVARMHIVLGEHQDALGEIFNCCAKKASSGADFKKIIHKISPNKEIEFGYPWSMAQGHEIQFSMEKAKKILGFEPKYSLEDSILNIYEWAQDFNFSCDSVNQNKEAYEAGIVSSKKTLLED